VNRAVRYRPFLGISLACSAAITTGRSDVDAAEGSLSSPRFRARRHLNTWFVHTVSTSHQRNTRTGLKCQLCNPPLLRHSSEPARVATGPRFHPINHDDIVVLKPDVAPEGRSGRLHLSNSGGIGIVSLSPRSAKPGTALKVSITTSRAFSPPVFLG
jgi:hypothetical protein